MSIKGRLRLFKKYLVRIFAKTIQRKLFKTATSICSCRTYFLRHLELYKQNWYCDALIKIMI